MFLKYVKYRTILGLAKKIRPFFREVTPNGIHLTLFEVLLPIYKHADLKVINPFAPGDFAEKRVLKLVEWFSGHCRAIKS